jgi:hypothetical protein
VGGLERRGFLKLAGAALSAALMPLREARPAARTAAGGMLDLEGRPGRYLVRLPGHPGVRSVLVEGVTTKPLHPPQGARLATVELLEIWLEPDRPHIDLGELRPGRVLRGTHGPMTLLAVAERGGWVAGLTGFGPPTVRQDPRLLRCTFRIQPRDWR